jgi:transposase-like protein
MDWESLYCPNQQCRYYGRSFLQGQLVKNGRSHGQQQALCEACETHVSIRYGTASMDLHADPAIFEMAVRAFAQGHAIRTTARIVQVDQDAGCAWLDGAAQHCRLVMLSLWRDLHVIACQRDALWSFVHTNQWC